MVNAQLEVAATSPATAKPKRQRIRPNYRDKTILRWSYDEAAEYSGFTINTLWTMASRGRFETFKHGFWRVDRVSFERYLTEKK